MTDEVEEGSRHIRRAGRFADDAGRVVTWSIADGRRGRRWRWTVIDRRGALVVVHTLETSAEGEFLRLESACPAGLLTLHREVDESIHGNRVSERGVEHLTVEAPTPGPLLIGGTELGVAILLGMIEPPESKAALDVLEVFDDLGIRIAGATIRHEGEGRWDVRTNRQARRAHLAEDGLPAANDQDSTTWPLERT